VTYTHAKEMHAVAASQKCTSARPQTPHLWVKANILHQDTVRTLADADLQACTCGRR